MNDSDSPPEVKEPLIVDVGGEGRHAGAWNLNPSRYQTFGPCRGEPIPRLIQSRNDAIPLRDGSVDVVIVERTPLLRPAIREILRIAKPSATILLRHVVGPVGDPHRFVLHLLEGEPKRNWSRIGNRKVRETIFRRDAIRTDAEF